MGERYPKPLVPGIRNDQKKLAAQGCTAVCVLGPSAVRLNSGTSNGQPTRTLLDPNRGNLVPDQPQRDDEPTAEPDLPKARTRLTSTDCRHWGQCNAPLCPLDPDWKKRRLLQDEPLCRYVLEAQKKAIDAVFDVTCLKLQNKPGKADFDVTGLDVVRQTISDITEHLEQAASHRRRLERACTSGSKRSAGKALAARQQGGPTA